MARSYAYTYLLNDAWPPLDDPVPSPRLVNA
jgi:hypothetical protein